MFKIGHSEEAIVQYLMATADFSCSTTETRLTESIADLLNSEFLEKKHYHLEMVIQFYSFYSISNPSTHWYLQAYIVWSAVLKAQGFEKWLGKWLSEIPEKFGAMLSWGSTGVLGGSSCVGEPGGGLECPVPTAWCCWTWPCGTVKRSRGVLTGCGPSLRLWVLTARASSKSITSSNRLLPG